MKTKYLKSKRVKVIGIGGAGMNSINNLIALNFEDVVFISINTDFDSFKKSKAEMNLLIGGKITKGKSAKGNSLIGRGAVFESARILKIALADIRLVFVIAGLGGGTGTGATPIIAKFCKDIGAKVIAIVTIPFSFEGKKRKKQAYEGLAALGNIADRIILTPNDRIRDEASREETIFNMFKRADEHIFYIIRDTISSQMNSKKGAL